MISYMTLLHVMLKIYVLEKYKAISDTRQMIDRSLGRLGLSSLPGGQAPFDPSATF
jgi:hypothetical protein